MEQSFAPAMQCPNETITNNKFYLYITNTGIAIKLIIINIRYLQRYTIKYFSDDDGDAEQIYTKQF